MSILVLFFCCTFFGTSWGELDAGTGYNGWGLLQPSNEYFYLNDSGLSDVSFKTAVIGITEQDSCFFRIELESVFLVSLIEVYWTPIEAINESSTLAYYDIYEKTMKTIPFEYKKYSSVVTEYSYIKNDTDTITNLFEFNLIWNTTYNGSFSEIYIEGTEFPTPEPTSSPTNIPSAEPSMQPTNVPTVPTIVPSSYPSNLPSIEPSYLPTVQPSVPTVVPSNEPTNAPIFESTELESTQFDFQTSINNEDPSADGGYTIQPCYFGLIIIFVCVAKIVFM